MKILFLRIFRFFLILALFCFIFEIDALGTELYINTNPIKSSIYIDRNLIGNTPARIKINNRKNINISIVKDGYKRLQKVISLDGRMVVNVHFDLVPDKMELILRDKGKVINICGMPIGETPAILYNVPNGMYEIVKNDKSYNINAAGYKYATRSTIVESLYSGGMLTFFLVGMNDLKNKGDDVGVAVTGFGSTVMTAILSYNLLKLFKLKIVKEKAKTEIKKIKYKPYNMKDDRALFTEGVSLLGQKHYKSAIEKFSLITKLYIDSQYIPISYYELGVCYYSLKDYMATVDVLNDFLRNYPIYELYQYAFYYYINSLIKLKKYNRAYIDYREFRPLIIEDESGSLYRMYFDMLIKLYKKNKGHYKKILYDIMRYIDYYLKKYSNSTALPDIMVLKANVLYSYLDRRKGLELIDELKQIYGKDQGIMKKLESIVIK